VIFFLFLFSCLPFAIQGHLVNRTISAREHIAGEKKGNESDSLMKMTFSELGLK
jgi:hypothetical protein